MRFDLEQSNQHKRDFLHTVNKVYQKRVNSRPTFSTCDRTGWPCFNPTDRFPLFAVLLDLIVSTPNGRRRHKTTWRPSFSITGSTKWKVFFVIFLNTSAKGHMLEQCERGKEKKLPRNNIARSKIHGRRFGLRLTFPKRIRIRNKEVSMWVSISNMNTNPNSEEWLTVYIHVYTCIDMCHTLQYSYYITHGGEVTVT
jgi:hypothetical protein